MRLAIRIGTGLAAFGLAGALAACGGSTPSGTASSVSSAGSSAVSSASSAASSVASSASSGASSLASSGASSASSASSGSVTINNITGGSTTITFDQNFTSALNTLHFSPSASGNATLSGNTATFPVTGGTFTLSNGKASGMIKQSGGIELTAGPAKINLTNFVIDPAANALYADIQVNGQTLASHVAFFTLDASGAQTQTSGNSATISGVKLTLSNDAATALNRAANTQAIQGNFPVGTATIKLQGS